jgi:hypothetical protein
LFLIDNNYQGTLLGDCYGANVGISLRSSGSIAHAACVAHARRKVRDARDNHSHHARVLLSMFRELYDLEDLAKSMDEEGRRELRQQESLAIWTRMRSYLAERTANVLPREAMAQAIGYLNNQWDALTLHLTDGAIPIDNNETEQLMKQVALGRKNWLFAGSISAGYRAADLMTLTSSAIRNHLDVWSYVDGVLSALLDGSTDYAALRPDTWATAHPEHVRHYREKEKQDRSDATKRRRQRRRAMMNK